MTSSNKFCNYHNKLVNTSSDIILYILDFLNESSLCNLTVNKEFNIFVEKKEMLLTISKDYLKKLSNVVGELQFPMLEKYLGTKYASPHSQNLKCKICNLFVGKSNKSLAKHQQSCAKKMENVIVVK